MTLEELENIWLDGVADDFAGGVDSIGHFYRVDRYVVETDSQGFHTVHEFETEREADDLMDQVHFAQREFDGEELDVA